MSIYIIRLSLKFERENQVNPNISKTARKWPQHELHFVQKQDRLIVKTKSWIYVFVRTKLLCLGFVHIALF